MAPGRPARPGKRIRRDGPSHRRGSRGGCRVAQRCRHAGNCQVVVRADPPQSSGARRRHLAQDHAAARAAGIDPRRGAGAGRADAGLADQVLFRSPDMKRLLIVEDKESLALMLKETVEGEGLEADISANGSDAMRRLAEGRRYFAVLTDLRLPGADGIGVLRQVKESDPDCPVIVMTAFGTIENAVEAMKLGAYDFIQKPIDVDYLLILLRRCQENRELRHENLLLKEEFQQRYRLPAIIGDSPRIVEVSNAIQRVAPTDSSVLLQGESGTGKELFARAIHQLSPRRDRPFVAINCAAIPDTLIENELFGHEKGAFTGATGRQLGKFELADTGTSFLDEIGELGRSVNSKILRVLQEHRFDRVGGAATIDADVRVICATNRNLTDDVKQGRFREDLFF